MFFRTYPKYEPLKETFFSERMKIMREALKRLEAKNYLYIADEKHNYDLLVKNTWMLLSGWYGFSIMFDGSDYSFSKQDFFLSIWNLYVHHLTPRGRSIVRSSYKKILSDTENV